MAYKLRFHDGLTLEVDTADELRVALDVIRAPQRVRQTPTRNITANQTRPAPATPVSGSLLRKFLKATPGRQRTVLNSLSQAPQGLTDEQLRTALGLQTNAELGGTMAGLAKNAQKLHFGFEHVLTKTQSKNGTGRHYHYTMTEEMRSVMPRH